MNKNEHKQSIASHPRRLCIAGFWHQATVMAACFAEMGHTVVGVGDDPNAARELNEGRAPVLEPQLDLMLLRNIETGRLRFTTSYSEALSGAEFAFVAIDTPVDGLDRPLLDTVVETVHAIAEHRTGRLILCVTAQVPVGTSERLLEIVRQRKPRLECNVAYIPEFLRLSEAVETFFNADRFIIGAQDKTVAERVAKLYEGLARPILLTKLRSAEMTKHASNTFLATSISFVNEISDICEHVGADVAEVVAGMKLDQRIGQRAALSPGLGFAGGTLGRDIRALQELGRQHAASTPLLDAVSLVNCSRCEFVVKRLHQHYESLNGLQIGVFGLTYKPGTSTLRRSIALEIIGRLAAAGAVVTAFDPLADFTHAGPIPKFESAADAYQAAAGRDALLLLTEWSGIRDLDWERVRTSMRRPLFIDSRNFFEPESMASFGFIYVAVGRGARAESLLARGV
jgi:UDPglucose 6-dehydrogenase